MFSLASNAMFTNNWKVFVLNFLKMGDTVFLAENLMEMW